MFRIRLQLMIIFSTNQLIGQTNRCIMLDRLRISVTESRLPSRRKLSLPLRFCLLSQHRSLTMILHIHRNVVRPSWWSNKESSYSTLLNWCYKTGNECLTFSYFSMQKRNKRNLFDGGLVGADSLIATVGMIQWQEWTLTKADSSGGAVHTLSMEVFNVWWEEKEVRPIVPRSTAYWGRRKMINVNNRYDWTSVISAAAGACVLITGWSKPSVSIYMSQAHCVPGITRTQHVKMIPLTFKMKPAAHQ